MKIVLQVAACALPVCAVAQTTASYSLQEIGKYEIHQVKKGETLYSLSRRYGTTVPALLELNPSIVNNNLKTGSTIKVPKQVQDDNAKPEAEAYRGIGPKPYLSPVYYEVAAGETLYSISQKTGNDVEVVKLWNDLKNNNIRPKQKLVVGYAENAQPVSGSAVYVNNTATRPSAPHDVSKQEATKSNEKVVSTNSGIAFSHSDKPNANTSSTRPVAAKEKPVVTSATASAASAEVNADLKTPAKSVSVYNNNASTAKLVYVNEKGICTWTRGSSESGSHYALHPTAPIGSTVNVKNMMNNRSVQVKVIGRLPDTPENENIAIKISGSAAKELNALDSKFLAQLSYMGYEAHKPPKS